MANLFAHKGVKWENFRLAHQLHESQVSFFLATCTFTIFYYVKFERWVVLCLFDSLNGQIIGNFLLKQVSNEDSHRLNCISEDYLVFDVTL